MKVFSPISITSLSLSSRYIDRLGLDPASLDEKPTLSKLRSITEAHVRRIPFENLAQHGGYGGPVSLDIDEISTKVLDRKRGGFCLELNPLLTCFLRELGYDVKKFLAHVNGKDGYTPVASHVLLLVTVDGQGYLVDVAFGEPAIHPLRYEFGVEQETPEGMVSRIVHDGEDTVFLEWFKDGAWQPRLKWKASDVTSHKELTPEDLVDALKFVSHTESPFSKQLIVTHLTVDEKVTLAGNRLKITTPRFGKNSKQFVEELTDPSQIRTVLNQKFGVPLSETESLALELEGPLVWGHM